MKDDEKCDERYSQSHRETETSEPKNLNTLGGTPILLGHSCIFQGLTFKSFYRKSMLKKTVQKVDYIWSKQGILSKLSQKMHFNLFWCSCSKIILLY